jgi:hypothetical protein
MLVLKNFSLIKKLTKTQKNQNLKKKILNFLINNKNWEETLGARLRQHR